MEFNIKSFRELKKYIAADLYRYMTSTSLRSFLRAWYIAGFRYCFFMRCCKYFYYKPLYKIIFFLCRIILRHYSIKYGFQIPWQTNIGPGLFIGHYGTIIVNPNSTIGINCNISIGMLIGLSHKLGENGRSLGFQYPWIGNRVSIGNNAKIIGGVKIKDGAVIGISSVITHDIEENEVVVGIPAHKISDNGSKGYVGSFHPWTVNLMKA